MVEMARRGITPNMNSSMNPKYPGNNLKFKTYMPIYWEPTTRMNGSNLIPKTLASSFSLPSVLCLSLKRKNASTKKYAKKKGK